MTSWMEGLIPYGAGSLLSAGSSPVPLSKSFFLVEQSTPLIRVDY